MESTLDNPVCLLYRQFLVATLDIQLLEVSGTEECMVNRDTLDQSSIGMALVNVKLRYSFDVGMVGAIYILMLK